MKSGSEPGGILEGRMFYAYDALENGLIDSILTIDEIDTDGNTRKGLAEEGIKNIKVDDIIQFERFGYCRFDGKNEFWFTHK